MTYIFGIPGLPNLYEHWMNFFLLIGHYILSESLNFNAVSSIEVS